MGNRSFLYINKNNSEDFFAFEGNNTLPFFWLTLIDIASFEKYIAVWKAYELYADTYSKEDFITYQKNNCLDVQISFEKFEQNHLNGKAFINNHYPDAISLYTDFINTLKIHFKKDDILKIEMDQLAGFYDSLDQFHEVILREINTIQKNSSEQSTFFADYDLIATGIGFESISLKGFTELPSYKEALKNRKKPTFNTKVETKNIKFDRNPFIFFLVILLLCPLFTFITYKGFKKESFSGFVIFIGVVNIFAYWISFNIVIKNIHAYIRKRK